MNKKTSFVLRFYGVPQADIESCVEKLKPFAPGLQGVSYEPLTQSVNVFVPHTENTQVRLHFSTADQIATFSSSAEALKTYQQHAVAGASTLPEVERLKPGMMTFRR